MGNGKGLDLSVPLSPDESASILARLRLRTTTALRTTALGDCWEWTGARRNGFHGCLSVHDYPEYIHQLSFAIHHGPIPAGRVVRHLCDNPPCWRPDHLTLGTQADNVKDMRTRGRASDPPHSSGEKHHKATLSDAQVSEIRQLWASGGLRQREIAARFGVNQATVWRFIHGVRRQNAPQVR